MIEDTSSRRFLTSLGAGKGFSGSSRYFGVAELAGAFLLFKMDQTVDWSLLCLIDLFRFQRNDELLYLQ